MDPNENNRTPSSAEEEKARLREHYRQQDSPLSAGDNSGRVSFSSPSGTTNTVPMTEEELRTSPVHSPSYLASPASPSSVTTPLTTGSLHAVRSLTPPPYSGPSTPAQKPPPSPTTQSFLSQPRRHTGLPPLDYRLYNPPLFTLSSDRTTIRSSAPYLSTNVSALISLIRQHATVPPKPQIHISGKRHSSTNSPDFAIKLNLMHLLIPHDPRQKLDYLRCVSPEELALRGGSKPTLEPHFINLEEWAKRYVEDNASQKSFTLERVVANLDVNWLEGQIRALVAEMKYPGIVTVSFPVTHNKVVVSSPEKGNKFLASVAGLFSGKKKYEVVKAVWPFATGRSGEEGRRVVTLNEEDWWREWREAVRFAISTKRRGWVTLEDKLEVIMEGEGNAVNIDWGSEPFSHTPSWD